MTLYEDAVEMWGEESQLGMVQEECAELIAAINQYNRGRITKLKLAEEVADVEIVIKQAREIVGPRAVDIWKSRKESRLLSRIKVENETTN